MPFFVVLLASLFFSACQENRASKVPPGEIEHPRETPVIRHVIVVAMENNDADVIYGGADRAPYINDTLLTKYAHAVNFVDPLPTWIPSEPHYVWMEAGTNALPDHVFQDNSDALLANSTSSGAHLVAQIRRAANDDWMSYQEGIDSLTGACPVASSGLYAAKHNPFVFFRDVSGNPPSKTNAYCASHHRPLPALYSDLAAGTVAAY
ncbi:MAG TPA: hypothetical protein VHO02_07665, partial [Fibrobacteria bacterium]|nr:hypothetical protein [Fibrobacteria bacterium]